MVGGALDGLDQLMRILGDRDDVPDPGPDGLLEQLGRELVHDEDPTGGRPLPQEVRDRAEARGIGVRRTEDHHRGELDLVRHGLDGRVRGGVRLLAELHREAGPQARIVVDDRDGERRGEHPTVRRPGCLRVMHEVLLVDRRHSSYCPWPAGYGVNPGLVSTSVSRIGGIAVGALSGGTSAR